MPDSNGGVLRALSPGGALKAFAEGAIFVAFDLETTGLDSRQHRVVEIGAVKFDRKGLIARFSALVNPGVPMPAEAEKANGISDEMLAGKPPLEEALPDFLYFIRGAVLAAHNAPFDCGFINASLARFYREGLAEFPALPNPVADTLAFSREAFPGRRSYSLQNLALDFGVPAGQAHRAEDDARVCMEILNLALDAFSKGPSGVSNAASARENR